jgi:hypothetical protein
VTRFAAALLRGALSRCFFAKNKQPDQVFLNMPSPWSPDVVEW